MKPRNINYLVIASALLTVSASAVNAQSAVYRWVDSSGVVHFSDSPPDAASGIASETIAIENAQTSFRPVAPPAATARESANTDPPDSIPAAAAPAPAQAEAEARAPARVPAAPVEQCSDPSPTIRSGQDLYDFDGEATSLEPQYVEVIRRTFRSMQGRWRGPDSGFYCLERGSVDEKRPFNRTIEAEGDLNPPDRFVLDSTLQSQGSNRREMLRIELRDRKLVVNSGTATLISASEGELEFGYKVQVGGIVTEYYWQIVLAGMRTMTLRQWTYTQGELSASSIWNLTQGR